MKNLINIDRLHKSIELINSRQIHPHGIQRGITTAYLYLMLGEVWLGDIKNAYLYIGESRLQAEQMCRNFKELINEHIENPRWLRTSRDMLVIDDQFYMFISAKGVETICGQSYHRVFLDVSPETRDNLMNSEGMKCLQAALVDGGDIV